jgi:hypothetical protein
LNASQSWRLVLAGTAALLLAGCAAIEPQPLDPDLFPARAAGAVPRDGTPLALTVAMPDQTYTSPPLRLYRTQVQLPVGRIVEAAARLSLAERFTLADSTSPDAAALAVRVTDVAPEIDSALVFLLPGPWGLMERVDITSRLAFTLTVTAADGSVRWTRRYDSALERVQPRRESLLVQESRQAAMQRHIHEQAAALMRAAAGDLADWLAQERRRERVL